MDNIIAFGCIEEKMNCELSQGFRTTYEIIIKEIAKASKTLTDISGAKDADSFSQKLIIGANKGELISLCTDLEKWGNHLVELSEAIKKNSLEKCKEESNDNNAYRNTWLDEILNERFYRGGFIVDQMLRDYKDRLIAEWKNDLNSQLSGKKEYDHEGKYAE